MASTPFISLGLINFECILEQTNIMRACYDAQTHCRDVLEKQNITRLTLTHQSGLPTDIYQDDGCKWVGEPDYNTLVALFSFKRTENNILKETPQK